MLSRRGLIKVVSYASAARVAAASGLAALVQACSAGTGSSSNGYGYGYGTYGYGRYGYNQNPSQLPELLRAHLARSVSVKKA
jgi:hypothetical protein